MGAGANPLTAPPPCPRISMHNGGRCQQQPPYRGNAQPEPPFRAAAPCLARDCARCQGEEAHLHHADCSILCCPLCILGQVNTTAVVAFFSLALGKLERAIGNPGLAYHVTPCATRVGGFCGHAGPPPLQHHWRGWATHSLCTRC